MDSSQTVLVLDDEAPILELFVRCLAELDQSDRSALPGPDPSGLVRVGGLRLLLAKTGEEAVRLVETELSEGRRVACAFVDLKLAVGMDGVEALRCLRAVEPDLLCTVVSGHGSRAVEDIQAIFLPDHGDEWDFLAKPFSPWEIRQKCRQMLASWQRRRLEEAHVAEIRRLARKNEERQAALEERLRRRSEELAVTLASRKEQGEGGSGRRTPGWRVTEASRLAVRTLLDAGYPVTTVARAMRMHRSTVWTIERELRDKDEVPRALANQVS